MRYVGKTDTGLVRDHNEDRYFTDGRLFVVADGMGGHRAGEVASARSIEVVAEYLLWHLDKGKPETILAEAIMRANEVIYEESRADAGLAGMGTTFTCFLVLGAKTVVGHVGDSRAYLWRAGHLTQLTEDHSLVADLVREGRITEEQAFHHPQRNIITKALGVDAVVEVDIATYNLEAADLLLLCSDGLTGMVRDAEIATQLGRTRDLDELGDVLIAEANARGGVDNITLVLIDLETDPLAVPANTGKVRDRIVAPEPEPPRTRFWASRKVIIAVLVLLLLAVGTAAGLVLYARNHYYFVGIDREGDVVLCQGLRWEPLGIHMSEVVADSGEKADNLPDNELADLRNGEVLDQQEARRSFDFFVEEARVHRRLPDFKGGTLAEARLYLEQMGLKLEMAVPPPPDTAVVASQQPEAGIVVETGSVVTLTMRSN